MAWTWTHRETSVHRTLILILKTCESVLGWPVLLNEVLDTEISNSTDSSNYDQTFHLFIGGNISSVFGQVCFQMARWRSSQRDFKHLFENSDKISGIIVLNKLGCFPVRIPGEGFVACPDRPTLNIGLKSICKDPKRLFSYKDRVDHSSILQSGIIKNWFYLWIHFISPRMWFDLVHTTSSLGSTD